MRHHRLAAHPPDLRVSIDGTTVVVTFDALAEYVAEVPAFKSADQGLQSGRNGAWHSTVLSRYGIVRASLTCNEDMLQSLLVEDLHLIATGSRPAHHPECKHSPQQEGGIITDALPGI